MAKKPKKLSILPAPKKQRKTIDFPDKLLHQRVTAGMLSRGTYQKKMLAYVLPLLLPKGFNGLGNAIDDGNIQAIRILFEQAGLLQPAKGATTIIAPQFQNNNSNKAAAAIAAATADKNRGLSDFEDIVRILEEERSTITVRDHELLATPEGAAGE